MQEEKIIISEEYDPDLQRSQLKILEEHMAAAGRYLYQQYLKCKKP
ncbi:MAG: hypothetical protein KA748_07530 [Halomonas sp.]|nr:hypothetical protein [Halomonas sp.]MBP5980043.1 hypothetical protein [Halomonas sp.]